jgi:hypothetical protein
LVLAIVLNFLAHTTVRTWFQGSWACKWAITTEPPREVECILHSIPRGGGTRSQQRQLLHQRPLHWPCWVSFNFYHATLNSKISLLKNEKYCDYVLLLGFGGVGIFSLSVPRMSM